MWGDQSSTGPSCSEPLNHISDLHFGNHSVSSSQLIWQFEYCYCVHCGNLLARNIFLIFVCTPLIPGLCSMEILLSFSLFST